MTRLSEYAAIAALEDQAYLNEITQKYAEEREKFYAIPQSEHFYQVKQFYLCENDE